MDTKMTPLELARKAKAARIGTTTQPEEAMHPMREKRLLGIPNSMRRAYVRASRSRACAIKAFCNECCGYDRMSVKACVSVACPLYTFRPYQAGDDTEPTEPTDGSSEPTLESPNRGHLTDAEYGVCTDIESKVSLTEAQHRPTRHQ